MIQVVHSTALLGVVCMAAWALCHVVQISTCYHIAGSFRGLNFSHFWIFVVNIFTVALIPRPYPLLANAGGLDANA